MLVLIGSLVAAPAVVAQGGVNQYGNPLKHPAAPTTAKITAEELRTRLYIFSDDSMLGRQVGHVGNKMGTDYIAAELKRLGVEPAGDNGTYFQVLPYIQRKFTSKSTLRVNGSALRFNTDFVPVPGMAAPAAIANAQVIYGGVEGDTTQEITAEQAAGKFVILSPAAGAAAAPMGGRGGFGRGGFGRGGAAARFAGAAAVATINLDGLTPAQRMEINDPAATYSAARGGQPSGPADIIVTNDRGGLGIVRDGKLVAGALSTGQTAVDVQAAADAMVQEQRLVAAGTAARRDSVIKAAKDLLAAGEKGGTFTFYGETIVLDSQQVATLSASAAGRGGFGGRGNFNVGRGAAATGAPPASFRITAAAANKLLGRNVTGAAPGTLGRRVTANLDFVEQQTPFGRNVVGIIRGSDPKLAGEYVAIGAHNDHVGFSHSAVDHDSLKAWNNENLRLQMASGDLRSITPAQRAAIHVNMDSIRRLHPTPRLDSISNGADDDGSGSMAVLEIAEAVARAPVKPKRSILFVWHTGEEAGLVGSRYYADHPTVPLDSIVAQINIDMIGRGRAEDVIGGGDYYVGAVGSRRLSAELHADMLEVNARQPHPLTIDYRFDDPTLGTSVDGKPVSWPGYNNIYGRSDHANYANKCIPIVFFFTGLHGDYHQRTDEPQYIDYPHYAAITNYVHDLLVDVGDAAHRPKLDAPCTRR